ncbi:MAG: UDP-N-acetylglucosamine 2-epimerase (hydrolyzing), partial [Candidatus Electrothrix sp. ATG2]|nr:UDP-N-acetylglucosamine 2-epimerase (hydrolyzing) [Candidatus Electrothrix sp. ATG2]
MKRSVCVVSSGRADYGLLFWPMREIQNTSGLELQTVVTGMHLAGEYGMTVNRFVDDGFPVSKRVEMLLSGDSPQATSKSLGLAVIGFADAFELLQPDIILLLGDRFEIFAAAQAALVARIPVAHLFGGDTTEGAFDEAFR